MPISLDDGWTCPCGHEIDPETGYCIVWHRYHRKEFHLVSDRKNTCECHGYSMKSPDFLL